MAPSDATQKSETQVHNYNPSYIQLLKKRFWKIYFLYDFWCAQTFLPIVRLVAIFDRNFVKIVAPPSDEYENYVVKKRCKPHRNRAIIGNVMLVRTMHPSSAPNSEREQQQKNTIPTIHIEHSNTGHMTVTRKRDSALSYKISR